MRSVDIVRDIMIQLYLEPRNIHGTERGVTVYRRDIF